MIEINQVEHILEEIKRGLPSTDSEVISSTPPTSPKHQKSHFGKNHNQSSNVTVVSRGHDSPTPNDKRPSTPIVGFNVTISSLESNSVCTKSLPPKVPKSKSVRIFTVFGVCCGVCVLSLCYNNLIIIAYDT